MGLGFRSSLGFRVFLKPFGLLCLHDNAKGLGLIRILLGLYWENGEENGNYWGLYRDYRVLYVGLYWDDGK